MKHTIEVPWFFGEHDLYYDLTLPEFEDTAQPLIERAIGVAENALERSNVSMDDLNGVLLAGGTSQIPLVRDLLERRFERSTMIAPRDLMWLIARGAAAHHRKLMTRPREAVEPRLGADLFLETFDKGRLEPTLLVPSTQKIPHSFTRQFAINPEVQSLTIQLLSETGTTQRRPVELERRDINLTGINISRIEVRVTIDRNRLIRFSVLNPKTGQPLENNIEIRGNVLLTPEQIKRARTEYGFKQVDQRADSSKNQNVAVGIDLGTTTCEAVVWHPEGGQYRRGISEPLLSKVKVSRHGDVTVGEGDYAPNEEGYFDNFKVDIGTQSTSRYTVFGRFWPPEILAAHLLANIWEQLQREVGQKSLLQEAVITVPSDFTEDQSALVFNAAKVAGIETPILLSEPVAAFLAYAEEFETIRAPDQKFLVFDFGGGTTDVCVIETRPFDRTEIVGSYGNNSVGGKDLTVRLAGLLLRSFENEHQLSLTQADRTRLQRMLFRPVDEAKVALSLALARGEVL